jgi:hypothetical protein
MLRLSSNSPRQMSDIKANIKSEKGFIALMALGIFGLLIVFGIIAQLSLRNAANSISNNNDYFAAQDIANSVTESLLQELENKNPGYNSGEITCAWEAGVQTEGDAACDNDYGTLIGNNADVELSYEIQGRADAATSTVDGICTAGLADDWDNNCYVAPLEGTGNAGNNCESIDFSQDTINGTIDQLDHACHWNTLTFGNQLLSRAHIPLYHDDGAGGINQPFSSTNNPLPGPGDGIVIRLRTPCLPCVFAPDAPGAGERSCNSPTEVNYCDSNERYELDAALDANEVVHWEIRGSCGGGAGCWYIGSDALSTEFTGSQINASLKINNSSNILDGDTLEVGIILTTADPGNGDFLSRIQRPELILALEEKLFATEGNISHLEYQVLTSQPIANPETYITVSVSVSGNAYSKETSSTTSQNFIEAVIDLQ